MKKDVTGQVIERVLIITRRIRERMEEIVPYGPLSANMSPREQRVQLSKLNPSLKQQAIERMGEEEWLEMMKEIYQNDK